MVIILFAVLAITGVILFFSRPWETSVERHLRGYREADRRMRLKKTFWDRVADVWWEVRKQPRGPEDDADAKRYHERGLINLGYLEEQTFTVSDLPSVTYSNMFFPVIRAKLKKGTRTETSGFLIREFVRTNAIRLVTLKGEMPTWEDVLREAEAISETNK